MTGCNPPAVDGLLERLRHVRESDLQGSGRFSGWLVPELADRAVLVGCVLLVADGRDGRGAGQHQRQSDDPGAPAGAPPREPRVHGFSLDHPLSTLAEIAGRRKGWPPDSKRGPADCGRRSRLTQAPVCIFNSRMASLKRMAAAGAAVFMVLALASVSVALHKHDADVQSAGHADCDACHFRHLSGIETDGTPVASAPAPVSQAFVPAHPDGERGVALGIRPRRGPPA